MLKDLSSIRFQGANFSSMTALPIFSSSDGKKYAKASLLYGRNGSGKSTIAKAFRKIKGEDVPTVITADILDKTNQSVTLSKAEQAGIFVFDEDYVTANVRIERKGLDSIVMLGEQAEKELEQAEALVKTTENTLKEYQDMTNPKAPSFYINKIHNILQRDDGWAGRDSKARG
ncbi:MAG: AAA family ATPase, partial [Synergistaceae bacterium]|nr:AAA family ATPase [Synergistaceae bacterium]